MSQVLKDLTPVIVALIAATGSLLGVFAGYRLNKRKSQVEYEILLVDKRKKEIEIKQLEDDLLKSQITNKGVEKQLEQITSYKDYRTAFIEMGSVIRKYLSDKQSTNNPIVTMKLIAVAMTFSWEHFIVTDLLPILDEFPTATIQLDVLFIEATYLQSLNIARHPTDWGDISNRRMKDVQDFATECAAYHGRLKFTARVYRNLPHWHGWLVNDDHLFLGRTDWNFNRHEPTLRVGTNKYRHFDTTIKEGEERINLFKSWQKYYTEYASTLVCDSSAN